MSNYVEGISNDLFVVSRDFGARAALAMDLLSFCTRCGAVVYRRDLHDSFHKRVEGQVDKQELDEQTLKQALVDRRKQALVDRQVDKLPVPPVSPVPTVKRRFEIEWPAENGPMWLNTDNLIYCFERTICGQITVTDITDDGVRHPRTVTIDKLAVEQVVVTETGNAPRIIERIVK